MINHLDCFTVSPMNSSGFFMLEPHLELRYPMRKLTTTDTHHAGIPRQNYRH
ncbi:hypothetical protein I7101_001689 [Vibrio cholerae]|nr:hypothetical protein [Vibrio cholerae]